MGATKEQERQAVGMIRKTIEALGENSYIGAAMEGVLDIAESNIEYDEMCSMKRRMEIAQEQYQAAAETITKLRAELKTKKSFIDPRDKDDLVDVVRIQQKESEQKAMKAADGMAVAVFNGDSIAKDYANVYHEHIVRARRCKELDAMLMNA